MPLIAAYCKEEMACFFLQRRTCFTKNRMGELLLSTSDYYIKELGKR